MDKSLPEIPIINIPDKWLENGKYYCQHKKLNIVQLLNKKSYHYKYQCAICGLIGKKFLPKPNGVVRKVNTDFFRYRANWKWNTYTDFLKSNRWQELRYLTLYFHGSKCAECSKQIDINTAQVHHKHYCRPWGTENPETDLIPLCRACHMMKHK